MFWPKETMLPGALAAGPVVVLAIEAEESLDIAPPKTESPLQWPNKRYMNAPVKDLRGQSKQVSVA